ncbi:hypothetical protein JO972_06035 [Verrucomicrobiaceae bacterium 5K15]|uniref:Cytochrome b562 n=1 Tax=Oceaniferula flava TaxID=2800421 RepID=A0AAE2SA01_9BACT|nr:hypothetical protein [Oceaniferula flavus]MBK1854508.1 hypothetical protein [Oceaniferula flavus]MBM1135814.1 hypothetical protein [Oceaniferula flavus]
MTKSITLKRALLPVFAVAMAISAPVMAEEDHDHTPLEKAMKISSNALKSLRKIDKNDWAAGAEAARTAADGIRQGMEFIPSLVKDMADGKEKTKAIADYRRMMGLNYAALCELEIGYLEEDQEKIDAAMSKVKSAKKEGHKKYTDD